MLRTSMWLFGAIRLVEYITHPVIVPGQVEPSMTFEYLMGREPGFRRVQTRPT